MKHIVIILLFILVILTGCTTTKVVQIPVERTLNRTEHRIDTIQQIDSVLHYITGDSVIVERWRIRYISRTDTIIQCDTITVVNTLEVPVVKNELKWWQNALMWLGVASLVIVALKTKLK